MAMTAVGFDSVEPPDVPGCWCCSDRTVVGSLVRLGKHPEVGVCRRRVTVLARRKQQCRTTDTSRAGGVAVAAASAVAARFRALLMEVTCAACGCLVDWGVIVRRCDKHPACCCGDLEVRGQTAPP